MATYSNILAWRISWTTEPGGLQSMELQSQTQLKRLSMHTQQSRDFWPAELNSRPTQPYTRWK